MTSSKNPRVVKEHTWEPVHTSDLKEIKQAIVNYKLCLSIFTEILKTWALSNKATSQDWDQLTSAILESGLLLHFRCLCKEEARLLEKQETAEGIEISLDQILG